MATEQLFGNNRRAVREAFGKSDKDVLDAIEIIRNWVKTQPHLPEVPSDNMIEIFLTSNKFNLEETKQKLDMYYTIRSLVPRFYENSHPLCPQMINISDEMGVCVPLPKKTEDHYKVSILTFTKMGENFNAFKYFANLLNILEMKTQHDVAAGDVFILDYNGLSMSHVATFTPAYLNNISTVLEKVFSNSVRMHIINPPPFIGIIMSLVKVAFTELFARIYVHSNVEELYDYVPREILPKDYGGDEISMQELHELWKKCVRENRDRFDELDKMRVNEKLRPTLLENVDVLKDHGTLKNLNIF